MLNHKPSAELFANHHSEPNIMQPYSNDIQAIESEDGSSNGDVDYILDDFEYQEPLQRLHGTPLLGSATHSSLHVQKTFINLSTSNKKTIA